jgi:hypothetical protein
VPRRVTLHSISWEKFKVITSSRKNKKIPLTGAGCQIKAAANYFFCGSGCKLRLVQILGSKEGLPNKFIRINRKSSTLTGASPRANWGSKPCRLSESVKQLLGR